MRTGVASPSALRSQKAEAAAAAALLVKVRKSELIDSHSHGAELALFIAAQKGLLAELKELLKQGVAPNAVAPGRAPSCYIASQGGHASCRLLRTGRGTGSAHLCGAEPGARSAT